jgi:flagellar basal-body rod protein FlgG
MLQGLYAAASGMEAQQNQFNAISNDLSNIDTTGYQATEVGFQDLLYSSAGSASGTSVATGSGASSAIVGRSQQQGALSPTGRTLDVAISGPGFIEVRRNDGSIGLTRDGALQLDSQDQLTTADGNPLSPPVKLPKGTDPTNVTIDASGDVSTGNRKVGKITLVTVPAPDQLQPDGGNTYSLTAGSGAAKPATGTTVQQGSLEASNVNISVAMSDMISAERSYQLSSKAIQYQDQMLQIANGIKK